MKDFLSLSFLGWLEDLSPHAENLDKLLLKNSSFMQKKSSFDEYFKEELKV